jgi:ATP-dependent RNA helicase DHX37/DHR1
VLQMKSMHIDAVANFPFPTPPDRVALKKAETILTHLGALGFSKSDQNDKGKGHAVPRVSSGLTIGGHITELGTAMALFPVSPRFSKMLVAGRQHGTLPYIIAIVAALSVGNPFLHEDFLHSEDGGTTGVDKIDSADEDAPAELSYIKSADLRAKELRRLERRKFFKSQQVRALPHIRIL